MASDKIGMSYSGGKDSTALLLRLHELGKLPDKIVFADTLMEFPEMYDFIRRVEAHIGKHITKTKPNRSFLEFFFSKWVRGKYKGQIHGFPFVVYPCWYQREAKAVPLKKALKDCKVVYVGYAKGEEKRVMKDKKFQYPLIEWGWTEKDCLKYCKEKGFLNPLYSKFSRLGCWCCPKQSRQARTALKRDYPALWNILIQLEELSPNGFNPSCNLKEADKQRQLFGGLENGK